MVMAPVELWIAAVASVSATTGRPLQQPDQSDLVVSRQAAVARVWLRRRLVEAEQIPGGPAERIGLLAPGGEKQTPVLDAAAPAVPRDELWADGFQDGEGAPQRA